MHPEFSLKEGVKRPPPPEKKQSAPKHLIRLDGQTTEATFVNVRMDMSHFHQTKDAETSMSAATKKMLFVQKLA